MKLKFDAQGPRSSLPTVFVGPNQDVDVNAEVSGTFDTVVYKKPIGIFVTLHINLLAGHVIKVEKLPIVLGFQAMDQDARRGIVFDIDLNKLKAPDESPKH